MSALCQKRTFRHSLDHLISAADSVRGVEAEHLSGLEVDEKFDLCELLHRQVGGLLALEDAIDPACGSLLLAS